MISENIKTYKKPVIKLLVGQLFSAIGIVAMIQANIGLDPWNVLHMGISRTFNISLGSATIIVGATAVIIAGIMGEKFGFGTIANVIFPGLLINFIQHFNLIPLMHSVPTGIIMMFIGQSILAVGTYYYLAAFMGAGPRDALMVAVSKKTKRSVGLCRSTLEVLSVIIGWLIGGKVGIGTLLSALTIGFFLQTAFSYFKFNAAASTNESIKDTLQNLKQHNL